MTLELSSAYLSSNNIKIRANQETDLLKSDK